MLLLGIAWCCVAETGARGQEDGVPDAREALRAFRLVEGWVREGTIPPQPGEGDRAAGHGAAVVIRAGGDVVGRGTSIGDDGMSLWRASVGAIGEANRRLPPENDALREEMAREMAAQFTVSVELAGALVPIDAAAVGSERCVAAGMEGVAARSGERMYAMFPSAMMGSNLGVGMALSAAASRAGEDPALGVLKPQELATRHAVQFYRFGVVHVVQASQGSEPVFLYRGSRLVGVSAITAGGLREMADRLAENLMAREWPGPERMGMTGTYEPWRDMSSPQQATAVEQLTAALALERYAGTAGVSARVAEGVEGFRRRVLGDMAEVGVGEIAAWEDAAASAAWVALTPEHPAACARNVREAYVAGAGFSPALPGAARGMVALALVQLAAKERVMGGDGAAAARALEEAEGAVRRAYLETPESELVAQMPWLGWAELRVAELKGGGPVPAAASLRRMRELVWAHQVTATSEMASAREGGGADAVGGVVFAGGGMPTWQCARPMAFVATMLRDGRLTDEAERTAEVVRLVQGARFLRQLEADRAACWMYRNPGRALGGVRASLTDHRMPSDATAMALMCVCEMIRSLEVLAGR